jgi:hypothetical protein
MDVGSRDLKLDESLGLNCAWYADILMTLTADAPALSAVPASAPPGGPVAAAVPAAPTAAVLTPAVATPPTGGGLRSV